MTEAAVRAPEASTTGSPADAAVSGYSWAVAIFAARETPEELFATLQAVAQACTQPTIIDVMVNGNPQLAAEIVRQLPQKQITPPAGCLRVWSIPLGGKAHAWNEYVHRAWPGTNLTFFVDGYARPMPDALELLAAALPAKPQAIAGTGVPSSGRHAARERHELLNSGGLPGCFFVLKQAVMMQFRQRGFRLPLGLYGFDTLLGAVLAFGLDPSRNAWNAKGFILVHPDVTWTIDQKPWWQPGTVKTQFKRKLNNALRTLVIKATRNFLAHHKLPPEQLPRTIEDFVLGWVTEHPEDAHRTLWKSPLCHLALGKLRQPKNWAAADLPPQLLYTG